MLIWLNFSSGAFRGCASPWKNNSSLSALTWPVQVCPLRCCGRGTGGSISLIAQHWLWRWPFWASQRFSANLLWRNFPLMNFTPFHAGGILRSSRNDACQRGHLHFGTTSSLFHWSLAAYLDGKINKIQRNYPERPWREKHLEKQMLFPHCQKWSDQNKMYLSRHLCSVIRRNTRGSLSFVVADLFEADSFPCTFYFGCVFSAVLKVNSFWPENRRTALSTLAGLFIVSHSVSSFLNSLTYIHVIQ